VNDDRCDDDYEDKDDDDDLILSKPRLSISLEIHQICFSKTHK